MVHLQDLHERYGEQGLFVYVIAVFPADQARKLTREMGISYPVFLGTDSELATKYAYG